MTDAEWPDGPREPDFERMLRDPALAFDDPMNVLRQRGVRTQDKRLILRRWEHMVRSRGAGGVPGGTRDGAAGTLSRIRDALDRLNESRPTAPRPAPGRRLHAEQREAM